MNDKDTKFGFDLMQALKEVRAHRRSGEGTKKRKSYVEPVPRPKAMRAYRDAPSLMADTKWRTLFTALDQDSLRGLQLIFKFVDVQEARTSALPWLAGVPHKYVDSFEFGPFPIKDIEWMEIPKVAVYPRSNNLPDKCVDQDLDKVMEAIDRTGKLFPIEQNPTGLRIVGHRLK